MERGRPIVSLALWCSLLPAALCSEKFSVRNIPEELLPSPAVIRDHSIHFTVGANGRSEQRVQYTVTIFEASQRSEAEFVLYYDRFRTLSDIEGALFDAEGEEIRELDEDIDVKDYSASSGYSLHEDGRIKHITLYHEQYPYTVHFSYTIALHGSFGWPVWKSQYNFLPVQKTDLTVIVPGKEQLRYWSNIDSIPPVITAVGGRTTYRWSASNLPPLDEESFSEDMLDVTHIVRIAPKEFSIEGYHGSMEDWRSFGEWYGRLIKGKNILTEEVKKEAAALVSSAATTAEKVNRLYEFLQKKTRYVSIQLGIGGWQPYDAMYVHQRGYGDCKALSNYMQALLDAVSIPSYPVLINSGTQRTPMITEFPSNQFNHMIVCVPNGKDSLWLECTSQSLPFGMLTYNIEDRPALLIDRNGGVVVRTPSGGSLSNRTIRTARIDLIHNGDANAVVSTRTTGNELVSVQNALLQSTPEERERWVLEKIDIPNIHLASLNIHGLEDRRPEIRIDLSAALKKIGTVSGTRLFFNPNLFAQWKYVPPKKDRRVSPVRFRYPFHSTDSTVFVVPKGFAPESVPQARIVNTPFATFTSSVVSIGDSVLVYHRSLDFSQREIEGGQYEAYRSFCAELVKIDREKIVLRKVP